MNGISISFHDQSDKASPFSARERIQIGKLETIKQTPAVDERVIPLSESDTADESPDFPQADGDNGASQSWILHSDA